jgi:predicted ribosome quality control (RQC) complex YloA/Tae2 family protein
MELSGIELNYLINEIKSKITREYYISNVSAITRDSFLFKLHHTTEPDIMLMISTKGIWITKLKFKQVEQNELIDIIKSEIERSKLETIEQPGSERVIIFKFRHPNNRLRILVVELFGDGNIVLCDQNMKILAILKELEVKHRLLKVGTNYKFPPRRGIDPFSISLNDLQEMKKNVETTSLAITKWIGRTISMPKKFVEEIVTRANLQAEIVGHLTDRDINRIYVVIRCLIEKVSTPTRHDPIVLLDENGKPYEALPIVIGNIPNLATKKVPTYMEGVDQVLSNQIIDIGHKVKTSEIENKIAILEHDIAEQNRAKQQVISKAYAIRTIANQLMVIPYERTDYFSDNAFNKLLLDNSASIVTEKGTKFLEVAGERVQLQSNFAKLSSMLFQRAKEMERGVSSIDHSRMKLLDQINKLKKQVDTIERKNSIIQLVVTKDWYERYRWFFTSDGLLAIGGRDASSNSVIIRKHLDEQSIIFHAEIHGSPFFIIQNVKSVDEITQSLLEVAQATVSFSRAWKDGLFSGDAYWVEPVQLKKGAPAGQFLPKGSFIIEGKRNYIKGIEIELAIGIIQLNNRYALCCGPVSAIKKKSLIYGILLPGGMNPIDAAKKVKNEFGTITASNENQANVGLYDFIKTITLDDFIRILPIGRSKINYIGRHE